MRNSIFNNAGLYVVYRRLFLYLFPSLVVPCIVLYAYRRRDFSLFRETDSCVTVDRTVNFKILDTVCRIFRPCRFQAAAGWCWESLQRLSAVILLVLLVMMLLLAIAVVSNSILCFLKRRRPVSFLIERFGYNYYCCYFLCVLFLLLNFKDNNLFSK